MKKFSTIILLLMSAFLISCSKVDNKNNKPVISDDINKMMEQYMDDGFIVENEDSYDKNISLKFTIYKVLEEEEKSVYYTIEKFYNKDVAKDTCQNIIDNQNSCINKEEYIIIFPLNYKYHDQYMNPFNNFFS